MPPWPKVCAALLVTSLASAPARGEEQQEPGTVTVVPGPRYTASWPYRLLFGGRWRDDWTTPLKVRKLDLGTFDRGLTPKRRGGGLQTKNLHLKGASGRSWVFRSVDKDPARSLDAEMRRSVAADVLRDLTSDAYPVAELVVDPLLEAVGVLHTTPELVVMPDDPRLGEFRAEFAGVLGMIEQRPTRGFAGADKMMATLDLFARLDGRSDEEVDAQSYLRARLIDVLVGDWDRHTAQWRWLRFREDGRRIWRPVPRDRDQGFSRFDGLFPSLAEYYTKHLASFTEDYPAIDKLTFSGRYTDRRFLVQLDRDAWRAVAADVVARLTDATMADAVRRLPPELYARDGAFLEQALRRRRDGLSAASDAFYRLLARQVDVYGTEEADRVSIRRSADGVEVTLAACDPATGEPIGAPFFHRSFRRGETSEIRLYLLGGPDRVVEEGERDGAITVRVVPGHPASGEEVTAGAGRADATAAAADDAADAEPSDDELLRRRYERFRDWGSDWLVFPQLSFDATRGLLAGARLQLTDYGFERNPFADQMNLGAAWSTGLSAPRVEYSLNLRTRSPLGVLAYVAYSGIDQANFFGFGDASTRDSALQSQDFYKVKQRHVVARSFVTATLVGPVRGRAGGSFEYFDNYADRPSLAAGTYGFGKMSLASAELGARVDTRTGVLTRRRGVTAEVSLRYYPPWLDNQAGFWKLRGEASTRLGARLGFPLLLVLRVAGEKNWGRYPFFEAAFLGGAASPSLDPTGAGGGGNTLRGFDLNRFAGDASAVANADLRIPLGKEYVAVLPLSFGLLGLADVGRVFLSSETSSRWHWGAGGGVWLSMRASAFAAEFVSSTSLAVVHSDEGTSLYILSAFGF